jgi:hypothetical protein
MMRFHEVPGRCFYFMAYVLLTLCACGQEQEASARTQIDPVELERSKACHHASNEARLKFLNSESSKPVESWLAPEAIVLKRRHHEEVCLEEARCLGIAQQNIGLYLKECLRTQEAVE